MPSPRLSSKTRCRIASGQGSSPQPHDDQRLQPAGNGDRDHQLPPARKVEPQRAGGQQLDIAAAHPAAPEHHRAEHQHRSEQDQILPEARPPVRRAATPTNAPSAIAPEVRLLICIRQPSSIAARRTRARRTAVSQPGADASRFIWVRPARRDCRRPAAYQRLLSSIAWAEGRFGPAWPVRWRPRPRPRH